MIGITDDYVAALQQTFTDDELAALQWLGRVETQMVDWLIEAEQLSFPGPPMPPAERLATVLFPIAGETDPERRRVFAKLGPQSPRKLQEWRRQRLAATFLHYRHRDKMSKEEFIRTKLRFNKQLPKTEQRGANSASHTALLKCLDRGLREIASHPALKADLEMAGRARVIVNHAVVRDRFARRRGQIPSKTSGQT